MSCIVLDEWQAGRLRWTDAVAALGLAGLPQLYVAAYRHGVGTQRRFAEEVVLPDLARRHDLTLATWRANPIWHGTWYRDFDREVQTTPGYGTGPGHAQRRAEWLDRGIWWLVREQLGLERNSLDVERMEREAASDRARLRRIRHRVTWLELAFDPIPDDPCRAVVEMWSAGETSTTVACEIIDVDLAGLVRLAGELGVPLCPGVSITVAWDGLPDSVFERIQRLADENPEDE